MSEQSNEYSVEWFRWMYINNPKWLGTRALRLWEHYAALEAERNEILQQAGDEEKRANEMMLERDSLARRLETMEGAWATDRAILKNYEVLAATQEEKKQ